MLDVTMKLSNEWLESVKGEHVGAIYLHKK